jgi:hypothetical protein
MSIYPFSYFKTSSCKEFFLDFHKTFPKKQICACFYDYVLSINQYSLFPSFKGIFCKSLSPRWFIIGGETWLSFTRPALINNKEVACIGCLVVPNAKNVYTKLSFTHCMHIVISISLKHVSHRPILFEICWIILLYKLLHKRFPFSYKKYWENVNSHSIPPSDRISTVHGQNSEETLLGEHPH